MTLSYYALGELFQGQDCDSQQIDFDSDFEIVIHTGLDVYDLIYISKSNNGIITSVYTFISLYNNTSL